MVPERPAVRTSKLLITSYPIVIIGLNAYINICIYIIMIFGIFPTRKQHNYQWFNLIADLNLVTNN